jgi:hypothetical protein
VRSPIGVSREKSQGFGHGNRDIAIRDISISHRTVWAIAKSASGGQVA